MDPKNKIAHTAPHKTSRGLVFSRLKDFQVHCKAAFTEGHLPSISSHAQIFELDSCRRRGQD
jgi:hypothetical protein